MPSTISDAARVHKCRSVNATISTSDRKFPIAEMLATILSENAMKITSTNSPAWKSRCEVPRWCFKGLVRSNGRAAALQPVANASLGTIPELFREPNENSFGASDVAEPIYVLIPDHFADELGAAFAET